MKEGRGFQPIANAIRAERRRQDARPDGGIRRAADDGDYLLALAMLTEGVGYVAKEARDGIVGDSDLRAELIRIAAIAAVWAQVIDDE